MSPSNYFLSVKCVPFVNICPMRGLVILSELVGVHQMFSIADTKLLQESIIKKSVFPPEQLSKSDRWLLSFDNILQT